MRTYNEESFHGIPSNYPLKSPSPDMKSKSSMPQTLSPYNKNFRKSFNHFTSPPNQGKNESYSQYATIPHFHQQITQNTEAKIDKMFSNTKNNFDNQRQYSSTHAKGNYVFEMSQQNYYNFDENMKNMMTTDKKVQYNQTHSNQHSTPLNRKNNEFLKVLEEKDMVIKELKDMINLMTQNGKHLKISQKVHHQQQYQNMKNEVKILTIENQKLSQVIDKLKQKNQILSKGQYANRNSIQNQENNLKKKLKEFQDQVNNLKQILQQKQIEHQNQLNQLKKVNQNLAIQCRFFETQKQRYSKENQRLINLLRLKDKQKQTCYNNYSYFDKSQYQGPSQNISNTSVKNNLQGNKNYSNDQNTSGNSRLSIQKIKAQYEENLKLYKENVYNQVYMMFDTINLTLEEINEKINGMQEKIIEMQKFKDSWEQRVRSHLTSMEQTDQEIKKSAIYIEEAPSSQRMGSSSGKSRQVLSVILQESRRDNQKLQVQISQLRKQVEYYKQTLQQKLSIKNSELQQQISQSFEKKIRELQSMLDQLREQKETIQNQLSDLKMQLIKGQKLNYQSTKFTELTEDQCTDQTDMQNQVKKMKQQIQILTEKLQQRNIKQHQLKQRIKQFQITQNIRQKQLLQEIEKFQTLIKQTQQEFKTSKLNHSNQINSLNQEIDYLKTQQIKTKMEFMLLKQDNESLKQKISNLEKINLSKNSTNQQNIQKINQLLKSFNSTSKNQDFYSSIKSYLENLENQIFHKNHDRNELIKITESQKDQILQLQQNKVELLERVNCLEEKLKIYKVQFEKSKQFYSRFLQSHEEQKINSKSSKTKAKLKIDELLNSQNKKITQLINSIASLSNNNNQEESS